MSIPRTRRYPMRRAAKPAPKVDWRCPERTPDRHHIMRCDLVAGHTGDHFAYSFGTWRTRRIEGETA